MNKIYNDWLKHCETHDEFRNEMMNYSKEEIEFFFSSEKPSFGTAGIRQKMGPGTRQFNEYTYKQIAIGFSKWICSKHDKPKIIIGHDNRRFSSEFTQICADVCSSFGIKVFLIKNNELKATPIISYLISHLSLDSGIIITASHNPKEYNGFKVYKNNGAQILPKDAEFIIDSMPNNDSILNIEYVPNNSLITEVDDKYINNYFQDAKECLINTNLSEEKKFPIIFTPHHGTAYKDLPFFIKSLGYSNFISVLEQSFPDSDFINSNNSNPEDIESFKLALDYAEKYKSNIILGVDPDADRLAVVVRKKDNTFKFISGNEMGIIFSYYCLMNKKYNKVPFIVSTFVSTNLIDRIAKDFSCKVFRTGTGFKWLAESVEKNYKDMDFVVAFEEAIGSLNSTINRDKDSFQAAGLALEIFDFYQKKDINLDELLINEIYPKYGYWSGETISFTIKDLNWVEKSNRIMQEFKSINITDINNIKLISNKWNNEGDCLEWNFDNDNAIRFRQSGTEPKFKAYINVYGNSLEDSKNNFTIFKNYVQKIIDNL